MTGSILVYDPTAPCDNAPQALRRALDGLAGKVVGFIDNAKPNFNYLADDLAELLTQRHGVRAVVKRNKRGAAMPATDEVLKLMEQECDLVITGSGD